LEGAVLHKNAELAELTQAFEARGESIVGLWGQVQNLHKLLLMKSVEYDRVVAAADRQRSARLCQLNGTYIDLTGEE
jgi:hypothetical protein